MSDLSKSTISQSNPVQDDTVSLVDLVAVLLRWRKLVIGLIIGFIILAGVVFIVFPTLGILHLGPNTAYETKAAFRFKQVNESVRSYFGEYSPLAQAWVKTASFIHPLYLEKVVKPQPDKFSSDFAEDGKIEAYITRNVLDKVFQSTFDKDAQILTLSFTDESQEISRSFVAAVADAILSSLSGELLADVTLASKLLDTSISNLRMVVTSENPEQTLVLIQFQERRALVEEINKNPSLVFGLQGDLSVTKTEIKTGILSSLSPVMGIVITIFVGIFFAFIMAFILEYIRKVKANQADMQKLKEALGKS